MSFYLLIYIVIGQTPPDILGVIKPLFQMTFDILIIIMDQILVWFVPPLVWSFLQSLRQKLPLIIFTAILESLTDNRLSDGFHSDKIIRYI